MRSSPPVVFAVALLASPLVAQVWPVRSSVVLGNDPQAGAQVGFAVALGDINGDGHDDLAVGAPQYRCGSSSLPDGRVDFYLGDASGRFTHVAGFCDDDSGGLAGWSIVIADFDGDAQGEIVVGAIGEAEGTPTPVAGAGSIWLLGWNGVTVQFINQLTQADLVGGAAELNDHFGHTLVAGYFDQDSYADLAIGVPYEDVGAEVDAGAIHVLYGTASGLTLLDHQTFVADDLETGATHPGDRFGWSLAAGDFDGGGADDLAVGAPMRTVSGQAGAGQVHVLYALSGGLSTVNDQVLDDVDLGDAAGVNEYFGYALAAGDFDDPGTFGCLGGAECADDLAIGIPGQDLLAPTRESAGLVKVVFGSETANGLVENVVEVLAQGILSGPGGSEALDFFGSSLAAGHLDAAEGIFLNTGDLVIGAPYEDLTAADAGMIHLLFGESGAGLDHERAQARWETPGFGTAPAELEDLFGFAMAIGDIDGDGWGDLVVGVPQDEGRGAVQVMLGALFADGFEVGSPCDWSAPPCF